jgi:hypothetical protein
MISMFGNRQTTGGLSSLAISPVGAIPDVAANADPETGYLTMSGGKVVARE